MRACSIALLSASIVTLSGCAGDDTPFLSGTRLEAQYFESDGARTFVDFRVRDTNRHCIGFDCKDTVTFTQTLHPSGIDGLSMRGLEGSDGSWMFQELYDDERDGPCSFQQLDESWRCAYVSRALTAIPECPSLALACDPTAESCHAGAIALVSGWGFGEFFYTIGEEAPDAPTKCLIDYGCPGCVPHTLTRTDLSTLPAVHTKWTGGGRYQLESWTNDDGTWTVPKRVLELLDTETRAPCKVQRTAPDADPVCTSE